MPGIHRVERGDGSRDFRFVVQIQRHVEIKVAGRKIDEEAGAISDIGGPENRQDQIGTVPNPISSQRLPKVLCLLRQAHLSGMVPEAPNADGRIEDKPSEGVEGRAEF